MVNFSFHRSTLFLDGRKRFFFWLTHIDVLIDDNDDELWCFLSHLFFSFWFDTTRIHSGATLAAPQKGKFEKD